MQPDALLPLFLPHLPGPPDAATRADPRELEQALHEVTAAARAAYPAITLADEVLLPALARRLPGEGDLPAALRRLHAGDLYLACACVQGDNDAVALLQQQHRGRIRAALLSMGLPQAQADDVEQALWLRLLVARPGDRPQIEGYSGKGPLQSWLCIVAVREARRGLRRQREAVLSEDVLLELVGADQASELGFLKQRYRDEFRAAFQGAVRALLPRERNILRCHLAGGMTNAQIGALCGVHPGTVKRWMAGIREKLLDGTRAALMARLRLTQTEVDSLIRLINSDLDMSFELMTLDAAQPSL